ncbi:MAG: isochorismatase family protein [Candidatus Paceibacterota bacterium]|jgi:nicotinamidase-related amidase
MLLVKPRKSRKVLIIVDPTNCFGNNAGTIYAKGSEKYIPLWRDRILKYLEAGYAVIIVRDWHIAHEGDHSRQWGFHSLQGTWESRPVDGLLDSKYNDLVYWAYKGMDPNDHGYSATSGLVVWFDGMPDIMNNIRIVPLVHFLKDLEPEDVEVEGIAFDYCDTASAVGVAEEGFRTTLLKDLCPSIYPENDAAVIERLEKAGVIVTTSDKCPV